ncbi:RadC family protein [Simiduia aestuariiviva]|uniref:DNA repair protein RadC n=1 Tax=Simiduia aestuariiviva TaxID=1510459 RepID=A0A839UV30_9GAMM|nr:DNA repair protein RadC [Simiduia aestuariiviva]MBB3169886.1 DNA repair protein RadC [Simiduia aestuariiviva]
MAIHHWPASERPREKLLSKGPAALSDAELLAIFLRTGVAGCSAVDLARNLLNRFGGLRPLLEASHKDFVEAKGLGDAKYAQLQAVLEMARRHLAAELAQTDVLSSPLLVHRYLQSQLRHRDREVFALLLLDNRHRVLTFSTLFEGTLDGASVYPREVVKTVLGANAAAVILVHNHPSGVAEPSQADIAITRRLKDALGLVDVRVLDHVIVGDGYCASLAELGLL